MGEETKKSLKKNQKINDGLEKIANTDLGKNNEEIQELLKKNLEISEEILEATKKIKRYVMVKRVWGWFKLVIIIAPIIIAAMYLKSLSPVLKEVYGQYQRILGITEQLEKMPASVDLLNKIVPK